jgi:hypothetical protein
MVAKIIDYTGREMAGVALSEIPESGTDLEHFVAALFQAIRPTGRRRRAHERLLEADR